LVVRWLSKLTAEGEEIRALNRKMEELLELAMGKKGRLCDSGV
jgi:hypothetical protein